MYFKRCIAFIVPGARNTRALQGNCRGAFPVLTMQMKRWGHACVCRCQPFIPLLGAHVHHAANQHCQICLLWLALHAFAAAPTAHGQSAVSQLRCTRLDCLLRCTGDAHHIA